MNKMIHPLTFYCCIDASTDRPGQTRVKKSVDDGCLAFFETEKEAERIAARINAILGAGHSKPKKFQFIQYEDYQKAMLNKIDIRDLLRIAENYENEQFCVALGSILGKLKRGE